MNYNFISYKNLSKKILLFLALLIILIFILPYFEYLFLAVILYIILEPYYKFLRKKLYSPKISASIVIISVLLLIILFLPLLLSAIYGESLSFLIDISSKIKSIHLISFGMSDINISNNILSNIYYYLLSSLKNTYDSLIGYTISIITLYFLFVEEKFIRSIFKNPHINKYSKIFQRFKDITYAIVYSNILLWGIRALLSYFGFVILGIKYPLLLSIFVFFADILPVIGVWTIWGGLFLYYILFSYSFFKISFVLIYGLIFVSFLTEIILKPILTAKFSQVHTLIVLLGILGGLKIFGFIGMFLGPILLGLSVDLLKEYLYN